MLNLIPNKHHRQQRMKIHKIDWWLCLVHPHHVDSPFQWHLCRVVTYHLAHLFAHN